MTAIRSPVTQAIIDHATFNQVRAKDIAVWCSMTHQAAGDKLSRMTRQGHLVKTSRGIYCAASAVHIWSRPKQCRHCGQVIHEGKLLLH